MAFWSLSPLALRRRHQSTLSCSVSIVNVPWKKVRIDRTTLKTTLRRLPVLLACLDSKAAITSIVLLSVFALLSPWRVPNVVGLRPESSVAVLSTIGGVAAALMGIVYALSIFRMHYLSQRLPEELVDQLAKAAFSRGILIWLSIIAVTSLVALVSTSVTTLTTGTVNVTTLNLVLLGITILRLSAGLTDPFDRSFSVFVVRCLQSHIPDTYLKSLKMRSGWLRHSMVSGVLTREVDPFAVVERVAVKMMKDGDLTTINLLIRSLTERILEYVRRNECENRREIFSWFGELLFTIGERSLTLDERVAELVTIVGSETLRESIRLRHPWSDRIEFQRSKESFGRELIGHGAEGLVSRFIAEEARMFEYGLHFVPPEEEVLIFHQKTGTVNNAPHANLEWEYLGPHPIYLYRRYIEALPDHGMSDAFGVGIHNLETMASVALGGNLGVKQKKFLLRLIIHMNRNLLVSAVEKTKSERFLETWMTAEHLVEKLEEEGFGEQVDELLRCIGDVVVEAGRVGALDGWTLNQLATIGRRLARKGDDKRTAILIEIFQMLGGVLEPQESRAMKLRYLQVADALQSLADFDQREVSESRTMVQDALRRFVNLDERRKEWREEYPSRVQQDPPPW